MNIMRDDSQPSTSLDRWQAEVDYSGEGSPVEVPLHWHAKHSERVMVHKGRLEASVGGIKRIVFAGETLHVPARAVHRFKAFKGERMVVRESADPAGDYKAA